MRKWLRNFFSQNVSDYNEKLHALLTEPFAPSFEPVPEPPIVVVIPPPPVIEPPVPLTRDGLKCPNCGREWAKIKRPFDLGSRVTVVCLCGRAFECFSNGEIECR